MISRVILLYTGLKWAVLRQNGVVFVGAWQKWCTNPCGARTREVRYCQSVKVTESGNRCSLANYVESFKGLRPSLQDICNIGVVPRSSKGDRSITLSRNWGPGDVRPKTRSATVIKASVISELSPGIVEGEKVGKKSKLLSLAKNP
jgi:hypothetical protein